MMLFTPRQHVIKDEIEQRPITELERDMYKTVLINSDILNTFDTQALVTWSEDDFIKKVLRKPIIAIELQKAGLI